jgi:hypothetical protein
MGRLRRHVTYANVVSTLALMLAVGGGGVYAAGRIGGQEIKKGAVRSPQIKNRQVRRQDIAGGSINTGKVSNNSLTSKDVREDTITGHDIQESSLGLVPQAQDARAVNGATVRIVRASQPDPSGMSQVVSLGGLTVLQDCGAGDAGLYVRGSSSGDIGSIFDPSGIQLFDSGTTQSVLTGGATGGFATVRRADGTVTRFDYELRQLANGFGTQNDCFLNGFLFSGK